MMARERWKRLPAADRKRLTELARKSHGKPMALTRDERAEFRRIAAGLDLFGMAATSRRSGGAWDAAGTESVPRLTGPMSSLQDRTRFEPAEVEPRIVERWLESGLHHPEPEGTAAENFSIAIPPPNVTGALHMGHALNGSIQDTLIRYHRMRGAAGEVDPRHRPRRHRHPEPGRARGSRRRARAARRSAARRSSSACGSGASSYGGTIIEPAQAPRRDRGLRRRALHARRALRPRRARGLRRRSTSKGLIYRDHYLVNWDPGTRSAISDLEVEEREVTDTLYHDRLPARRRRRRGRRRHGAPRDDARRHGRRRAPRRRALPRPGRARRRSLPLVGRELPIIADDYVKTDFGTGALKITPGPRPQRLRDRPPPRARRGHGDRRGRAHDRRRRRALRGPGRGRGAGARRRRAARAGAPAPHRALHAHGPVQPPLGRADRAAHLAAVVHAHGRARAPGDRRRARRARAHPSRVARAGATSSGWRTSARGASRRQLWWGHQIPVWYRGEETYVGTEPPEGEGWERDPDVLDTWFSSALWPFATLGWPEQTPELRAFYPTDVLSTARDILFLWVARMVMMGLEFAGDIPFERRLRALGHPGPRRAADEQVAGHGHRPDRRDRRARRRRRALRAAGHVLHAGRALLRREGPPGPAAGQQALQRLALRAAQRARGRARAATADARGPLDPVAAAGGQERVRREHRGSSTSPRPRSASTTSSTASCATGTSSSPRAASSTTTCRRRCCHVLRETLALAHPVIPFVTEELWSLRARHGRAAGRERGGARRRPALRDPEAEAADDGGHRGRRRRCARGATRPA